MINIIYRGKGKGPARTMTASSINMTRTPFHALRIVASFALLGALVAGSATILPAISALAAVVDLQAIGAVIGGIAGAVTQVIRT